jgi:hypothetical protein
VNARELLADIAGQHWREDAACRDTATAAGGHLEFVDVPSRDVAEWLTHRYCGRCRVVLPCRQEGDRLAPHHWRSVYGGVVYEKGDAA